ncbi:MAG: hypothetical protein ACTHKZ_05365 [Lysobacteraceae bacterium]
MAAAAALCLCGLPAIAGIAKVAVPAGAGLHLMWWPEVAAPAGWRVDENASRHYAFRALAPAGHDFSDAVTVMYAKAAFKPRLAPAVDLRGYIADDVAGFKADLPGIAIAEDKPVQAHGRAYRLFRFAPPRDRGGNWECVAYGEDGEFFLTFVLSSRTQAGMRAGLPAFRAMVASYRPGG